MKTKQITEKTGLSKDTIRFYEKEKLIPTPSRSANGYRDYDEADVRRLSFIGRSRAFGFSVDECRQLLTLYADPGRASADVKALAREHLKEVEAKIIELESMKSTLKTLIKSCRGDHRPDCPILNDLASV